MKLSEMIDTVYFQSGPTLLLTDTHLPGAKVSFKRLEVWRKRAVLLEDHVEQLLWIVGNVKIGGQEKAGIKIGISLAIEEIKAVPKKPRTEVIAVLKEYVETLESTDE